MATTAVQITRLKAAIASGARTIEYDDHKLEYKSVDEMFRALAMLQRDLDTTSKPLQFLTVRSKKGVE